MASIVPIRGRLPQDWGARRAVQDEANKAAADRLRSAHAEIWTCNPDSDDRENCLHHIREALKLLAEVAREGPRL